MNHGVPNWKMFDRSVITLLLALASELLGPTSYLDDGQINSLHLLQLLLLVQSWCHGYYGYCGRTVVDKRRKCVAFVAVIQLISRVFSFFHYATLHDALASRQDKLNIHKMDFLRYKLMINSSIIDTVVHI